MKYNELFKIAPFKNNIKYSIVQLLLYYQFLYEFKNKKHILQNDLIEKIYTMNNIDITIQNKIINIEEQINNFIKNIKDDII